MPQNTPGYDSPIIDAHHHLWNVTSGRYPWLTGDAGIGALGDVASMRRDYLPDDYADDYAADIAGQSVVASVHVEALWDRNRPAVEETAWLAALPGPPALPRAAWQRRR